MSARITDFWRLWQIAGTPVAQDQQDDNGGVALSYEVFVAPIVPTALTDVPPGETQRTWSPISSTLIFGETDAVLVDPLMTTAMAENLASWVNASGKNLTTIYATHGHGDHWFGASVLLKHFPYARFVATPPVVEQMNRSTPDAVAATWDVMFPDQIPPRVVAEPLENQAMDLEGDDLVVVELGHSDTDNTTCLHAPSIGLVAAGDAVYNDVHMYLSESGPEGRRAWLNALDRIEALDPAAVVAGHKRVDRPDSAETIEETRRYLRDFDAVLETTSTARELYDEMRGLHPTRLNPGMLWASAKALRPETAATPDR